MTTFTASEVVAKLRERFASGNDVPVPDVRLTRAEFDVIADRLEADERAMPAAYAQFTDGGCIRMWSRQYEERLPGTRMIPLYTHPDPADAERLADALFQISVRLGETREADMDDMDWHTQLIARAQYLSNKGKETGADVEKLAEALRMCMDIMLEHGVPIHPDADARVAYTAAEQALAAHSAQAQPPAASVTDEMVERARSAFVQADDGSTGIIDAIRAALLAALENPNG